MARSVCRAVFTLLCFVVGVVLSHSTVSRAAPGQDSWVDMPAGAKHTYIGIHGGTVPVSLLTASDGQSMITLVGRTGNDFLRALRQTTLQRSETQATRSMPESNATVVLAADTAIGSVPVFYCTGQGFGRMDVSFEQWQPFGLSEKPLLLEGQVVKPSHYAAQQTAKKYRRVVWQQGNPVLSVR